MRPGPTELIRSLRQRRGDDPGPGDGYLSLAQQADSIPENETPGPGVEGSPPPKAARLPAAPVLQSTGTPRTPNEGVSLTQGEGFFEGHEIKLNERERDQLRYMMARVVLRQLREESVRVRKARPRVRKEKAK